MLAPSTSPPMSTNCTAAGTTFADEAHLGQPVEAGVGHLGHADVGVGGREGVRRGERAAAGQRVVQRRLAGVGEADEAEAFHRSRVRLPAEAAEPGGGRRSERYRAPVDVVEALERIAYLHDRKLDPSQKAAAFLKAADVVRGLPEGELERRHADGKLEELPRASARAPSPSGTTRHTRGASLPILSY